MEGQMNRNDLEKAILIAGEIAKSANALTGPPAEGRPTPTQLVLPMSVVRGTRGYIEKVTNQVNGCYALGWFDACAVMLRRLVETLILECFEKHGISSKIKNRHGDFFYLADLISATLAEPTWNLGRNAKAALPRMKDIGDKSAHSRRFNAHRADVDRLIPDVRVVVQELVYLAGLK
jgi:hypothetical protein